MSEYAILFDTARCSACRGCQVACKCWNNLPSPIERNSQTLEGSYQHPMDLNGDTRLLISFNEYESDSQKGIEWAFGRRGCQHCTDAPCAGICPAGALSKDPETGFVLVDEDKCIGCQKCSMVCPFDVPRYHGPEGKINKCTACIDRIQAGMAPACVSTCQPNALRFGPRDEMIAEAKKSVERLKERGYADAMVYGEEEMGGLHVIQVLKYGAEKHGQVANPTTSPLSTMLDVMKPVAAVGMGATVVGLAAMFGLATGYKRDDLRYNAETQDTINWESGEVVKHGDPEDPRTIKEALTENLGKKKEADNE